jgi:hypothetical protein
MLGRRPLGRRPLGRSVLAGDGFRCVAIRHGRWLGNGHGPSHRRRLRGVRRPAVVRLGVAST